MNAENLARATFVLSRSVHEDLSYLSRRTSVSRSALVRQVLEPSIAEMARVLRSIPDQPTAADLDRFRGEALSLFDSMHAEGVAALDDLS